MPSTTPTPTAATWQATRLGLVVVTLDQLTKLAATQSAAGHTSGLLVPVRNPRFSLGLASATLPVMALLMAAGIATAGGYAVQAARQGAWLPGYPGCWSAGHLQLGRPPATRFGPRLSGHPWAVINLADLAVVAAVVGAALTHPVRPPTDTTPTQPP